MPAIDSSKFYREVNAIWPDLFSGRALVSPARNGVDRFTGKVLSGFPHVQQSMQVMFVTPFHQRVLRRWVGSFVPHILGESAVDRVITRFFWAIATAIDLWEPGYRTKQVLVMGAALQYWKPDQSINVNELLRLGQFMFRTEGTWYPRGHLGDPTPYQQQAAGIITNGGQYFDVVALPQQ